VEGPAVLPQLSTQPSARYSYGLFPLALTRINAGSFHTQGGHRIDGGGPPRWDDAGEEGADGKHEN
jgi:hypothetical protein